MNRYGNVAAALAAASIGLFALEAPAERKQAQNKQDPSKQQKEPQKPMRAMVILDASGSMRGNVGATQKMKAARIAMRALLKDWDRSIPLGLTVYGHRHRNRCSDIQTVFPVGKANARSITKKVDSIAPKGRTPITAALIHAAKALNYRKTRTTIILVSDGLETCKADPCAMARKLKRDGLDFRIHVVGLGLRKREIRALRCIADNSGGAFFEARSAGDLRKALVGAAGAVKATKLDVKVAELPATLDAPDRVQVNAPFSVKWKGQNRPGDAITITHIDSFANAATSRALASFGNPAKLVAPHKPGVYVIRYVSGRTIKVLGERRITVYDYKASVTGPKQVEIGQAFVARWTGPANADDFIAIVKKTGGRFAYGSKAMAKGDGTVRLHAALVPGVYEIRYMVSEPRRRILARQTIIVTDAKVTITAPATAKAGGKIQVKWTGPRLGSGMFVFAKFGSPARKYIFGTHLASKKAKHPMTLRVPKKPGVYEIRYRLTNGLRHRSLAQLRVTVTE